MYEELNELLKDFIIDAKSKIESFEHGTFTNMEINNPIVIRHKERLSKRYKSSVETTQSKVLCEQNNTTNNNESNQGTTNTHSRKCSKCKQIGHYAKKCPN